MPDWTPRPVVVQRILERALQYSVVLVRGTPACGKTVIAHLIREYIAEKWPGYTCLLWRGWPSDLSFQGSRKYMENELVSQEQLLVAKSTVVCFDDAQSSYYDEELWSFFKLLDKGSAKFILFSSYGSAGSCPVPVKSGTPPSFESGQRISLQWESSPSSPSPVGLLLQKDEADDLITRYCAQSSNRPILLRELRDAIVAISGGHAGALAGLVKTVSTDPASIPSYTHENRPC